MIANMIGEGDDDEMMMGRRDEDDRLIDMTVAMAMGR